ncbi:MAG: ATP synthase F1 subunit delta [Lachnospiraceae bacterium]|nr:ATP synthase F1 subunit delta [Lachnospiraceae bacterium]
MTQTTKNYGRVLYNLGVEREVIQDALEIFQSSEELRKVLTSPVVQVKSKLNIIDKLFKGFPKIFVNFLKQVCENHRMADIVDILESYKLCYNEENGIVVARFYYVTMPDDAQIEKIKAYLCKKYHAKEAEIIFEKDSSLIGGFLINVNNTEFDYSMRGRLTQLKQKLTWR